MVEKGSNPPGLTDYGRKCYRIMESGDDAIPERDDLAAMEFEQSQRDDSQRVSDHVWTIKELIERAAA